MNRRFLLVWLGCAMSIATNLSYANMLTNGSFEDPPLSEAGTADRLPGESTAIAGWVTTAFGVDRFDPSIFNAGHAADGLLVASLNKDYGTGGGIVQRIDTVPGQLYLVSFDVGTWKGINRDGFGRVTVVAGDKSEQCIVQTNEPTVQWKRCTVSFRATNAYTRVSFVNFSMAEENISLLDNVEVIPYFQ